MFAPKSLRTRRTGLINGRSRCGLSRSWTEALRGPSVAGAGLLLERPTGRALPLPLAFLDGAHELVLQQHVVLGGQAHSGTEDVDDALPARPHIRAGGSRGEGITWMIRMWMTMST